MNKHIFLLIILAFTLTFCTNNKNEEEYGLVNQINELDNECFMQLKNIIAPLFIDEWAKDSICSISVVSLRLFDNHYFDEENERFQFFTTRIYLESEDSIVDNFFGIDKKHSELVFIHYIVEYDIFTIDHHMKLGEDFTFLNDCLSNNLISNTNISKEPVYYHNKTFDFSENNIWVVDSISGDNIAKSPFYGIDTFRIVNNEFIAYMNDLNNNDSMQFEFEDYSLFIENSKNWVLSSSYNYKIIYNEKGSFTFVKKIRE